MKGLPVVVSLAIPLVVGSCATPEASPQVFHGANTKSLVIDLLDGKSAQIIAPTVKAKSDGAAVLDEIKAMPSYSTAVVVLENYSEPQLGSQFRNRTLGWFIGLRGLGYQHIVFLQGRNVGATDGLQILAEYD